jgi:5-methylcytosine-specific restriction endonuclease McrA
MSIINIVMGSLNNSREWAKFKKSFVGPMYPRSIRRQREKHVDMKFGHAPLDLETKKPRLDRGDLRLICDRKALHKKITPSWANLDAIRQVYIESKLLTTTTGIPHVVDHIIPRKHPLVCGLHNEFNLQILTRKDNSKKSNRFVI